MSALPKAILFDLDDTILSAYGQPHLAWTRIAAEQSAQLGALDVDALIATLAQVGRRFWNESPPEMQKHWRLNLPEARRAVVRRAFAHMTEAGHAMPALDAADAMADRFTDMRREEMHLFPGALETIDQLRETGVKLALITNGAALTQRAKVERFDLVHRFHHIQIEGEHGFGKPEEQAYRHAMEVLEVSPAQTWMVGDNLEWEVVMPQRLGIHAIWCDPYRQGLPADCGIRPDRIINSLPELLAGVKKAA